MEVRAAVDELADDVVGGDAFAGGVVVRDDAVAQDGQGDGADFLDRGGGLAAQQGERAGGAGEALRGARTGTVGDVVFDVVGGVLGVRAGGVDELEDRTG